MQIGFFDVSFSFIFSDSKFKKRDIQILSHMINYKHNKFNYYDCSLK